MDTNLNSVISDFVTKITTIIETDATERARAAVLTAFGAPETNGSVKKHRKPVRCPVPFCRGVAAPIFSMVCSKHKDVPKAQIKKYRDAKKAKAS